MIRELVRAVVLIVGLTVGVATAALAQASSASDPASLDEARKLMIATKMNAVFDQLATAQTQAMMDFIVKMNPGSEAAIREINDQFFMPEFRRSIPTLIDEMAGLYAIHFSADELRVMNAFYATPVGAKAIAKMPILMQQGMEMGKVWGQKVAEEALKKAAPKLRERGITL